MSAPEVVAPDRGAPPVQVAAPSRALPPFDGPAQGLPPLTSGGRADRWRLAWPILACTAALPLAFAFGLQGAVWTLPALVLGLRLLLVRRPLADDLRVPGAAWALAAFLVVAALGIFQVAGTGRVVFTYRWLLFAGALASEVWLLFVPKWQLSTERVVQWLGLLWIWVVAFGWAAMFLRLDQTSPLQSVLPAGFRSAGFVDQLSAWRLGEMQYVAGRYVVRPSAPFAWANGWGSAFALMAPCFVRSWLVGVTPRRRAAGVVLALAGIPPMVASLNRGAWLTLAVALLYGAVRMAARRDWRPLGAVMGAAGFTAVLLVTTPLGSSVTARLSDVENSNTSRASIYQLAWEGALESPVVGHGAPREVPGSSLPPVGTHGLAWNLMFSFGLVAAGLFLLWLVLEVVRSAPSRAPNSLWLHLTLVVGLLQLPMYGLLPEVVLLGVVAGLARREARP